ncbi:MAG: hypothetical protein ACRDZ3_19000 [Acidimicrobiia bacterium]
MTRYGPFGTGRIPAAKSPSTGSGSSAIVAVSGFRRRPEASLALLDWFGRYLA